MRIGIPRLVAIGLVSVGLITSCGKDTGQAATPNSANDDSNALEGAVGKGEKGGNASSNDESGGEPTEARLELEAEFHRTRFGLGTGIWVLGVVHNSQAESVTDVRVRVRMLDEAGELVGRADGRVGRPLDPGERAGIAVHVDRPVAHDRLELVTTAIVDPTPRPEPLTLRIEHDEPQRADFGGWYVVGRVENTGTSPIEGARIEIQGLDKAGKLLGIDWLELDAVEPGETIEFDVGDLRYEETPANFLLELRGPALD